jgi:hypothetical protein
MLFEECLQQNQVVKRQAINDSHGSFNNPIYLVSSSAGPNPEKVVRLSIRLLEEAKEHSY